MTRTFITVDHVLQIEVIRARELALERRAALMALCNRAYEEELDALFATLANATHVLGYLGATLVSHAMWVTRWLQAGDSPLMRTAYVEMVATEPAFQRRGLASAVMGRLAESVIRYDLAALDPAEPELYARLDWVFWRGPLYIRTETGLLPMPEERIMILRLPKTPELDLDLPLSA